MLPLAHKIVFFIYALFAAGLSGWGFYRLYLRMMRGAPSSEPRTGNLLSRIGYALSTTLTQSRTFRRRTGISILHSFIFYGFTYYLLVNVIDGLEGYFNFSILSTNPVGAIYNFLADIMSFLVLIGVIGLVIRRFYTPSKRDFRFNDKTLLHPLLKQNYINRDGLIVSAFICFHVGSRILGAAAKAVEEARLYGHYDAWQPFTGTLGRVLFGGLSDSAIEGWRIFGFWGALGSVLAFMVYFPYTKHIHIFMASVNYALKRPVGSGVLPPMKGLEEAMESEEPRIGVEKLEELEWPRLLDAYACIQCNRCQDVCPANATGKALSPAALEINKRMELNTIALEHSPFVLKPVAFESGASTARPLLEFAINEESVWGCTTCGACMQVCPVQDEQMLDIIDIRRHQVMVAGEFPSQLQTAFRGMERTSNPWGISRDKRLEWAEGLKVPTIDENPEPDVIYWVGCAAAYDPGAQKVARSFVQLLDKAGVNYAVLGKKEACTGDSARRAGNEFLYQTLAQENVETLNMVRPKLIVATCPHCMNIIGNEYKQLGGDYRTMHHTEYLETLVAAGQLPLSHLSENVTYHDPCYLGRHNGVFDAPRNLITKMAGEILTLERERENSFCCGAGGAQFWKEEEEGRERISDNRFRELQSRLDTAAERSAEYAESGKVVAVGCPFCKAMLNSTPEKQKRDDIVVKDVAELMLESMQKATGEWVAPTGPDAAATPLEQPEVVSAPNAQLPMDRTGDQPGQGVSGAVVGQTSADVVNRQPGSPAEKSGTQPEAQAAHPEQVTARKAWKPKATGDDVSPATNSIPNAAPTSETANATSPAVTSPEVTSAAEAGSAAPARKAWKPRGKDDVSASPASEMPATPAEHGGSTGRKAWKPKAKADDVAASAVSLPASAAAASSAPETETAVPAAATTERKKWNPKAAAATSVPAPAVPEAAVAPDLVAASVPAPTLSEPASSSDARPKWNPKAKPASPVSAAPVPESSIDSISSPITEHVQLSQVGENSLEEGAGATSSSAASTHDAPVNETTGRKKWVPKKKE